MPVQLPLFRRLSLCALALSATFFASGCAAHSARHDGPRGQISIVAPLPGPVWVEVATPPRRVWVPGHWEYRGDYRRWHDGYWNRPGHQGHGWHGRDRKGRHGWDD